MAANDVKTKPPCVLIVDDSRMVRAAIAKTVQGAYDVREADNGDAGWKLLLEDASIQVVISDLSMPEVDGYALLERIRASKLSRIRDMPVLMISGSEEEVERKRASALGASDFITKGIGKAELLARLEALSDLARTKEELDASRVMLAEQATTDPLTQLCTMGFLVKQGSAMYSYARRHNTPVAVLRLGLDNFEALRGKVGATVANQILVAVARLLDSRMRKEDCVARTGLAEFGIMSPGTTGEAAVRFSHRIGEEIRGARITWQGESVRISASIGACDSSAETVESFADLLVIAQRRMQLAQAAGGDHLVFEEAVKVKPAPQLARTAPSLEDALAMLADGRAAALAPYAVELARRIYPLVRFCDEVFESDTNVSAEVRVQRVIEKAKAGEGK